MGAGGLGVYPYTTKGPRGGKVRVGWRVRYRDAAGQPRETKLRGLDEQAAWEAWRRLSAGEVLRAASGDRSPLHRQGKTEAATTTLDQWADAFFATRTTVRDTTLDHERGVYERHIRKPLGRVPLADLDATAHRQWLAGLRTVKTKQPASEALRFDCNRILARIVIAAAVEGLYGRDAQREAKLKEWRVPWHGNAKPRRPEGKPRPSLSSAEQYRAVIAAAFDVSPQCAVATVFGAYNGLRRGELAPFQWGRHVIFEDAHGHECPADEASRVRIVLDPDETKNNRGRAARIGDAGAVRLIARWRLANPSQRFVFFAKNRHIVRGKVLGEAGRPLGKAISDAQWHRIVESPEVAALGIPPTFRFHDLRGSFCKSLLRKGLDLMRVARLMGHSNIATTRRYALELGLDDERVGADAMADIISLGNIGDEDESSGVRRTYQGCTDDDTDLF